LLSSSRIYPSVDERYKAFCFAMLEAGFQPDSQLMRFDLSAGISGGREGVRSLLERGPVPSAMVFTNDYMALGGMMELLARGFKMPSDVSIAGHDNSEFCAELEPALSSVDIAFEQMLSDALSLLSAQLDDGFDTPVEKLAKTVFIERASVAPKAS
jgi:LacI family transcriptional regulator